MKTVQQIMQETGAKANIRNFRYMQENYTYKQKVRHAENEPGQLPGQMSIEDYQT